MGVVTDDATSQLKHICMALASTLLAITQISSSLKKMYFQKFMKYDNPHVKEVSLAIIKILCHHRANSLMANVWPGAVAVD